MVNKCALAVIRTKRGSIHDCFTICTKSYMEAFPKNFVYKNCYICDSFDISEYVGGDILIKSETITEYSNVKIKREITVKNCYEIQVWSLEV